MSKQMKLPQRRLLEIQSRKPISAPSARINAGRQPVAAAEANLVEIYVYDYIDQWGFDVAAATVELAKMPNVEEIVVKINSPGGNAFDGVAFFNTLLAHPANVRVEVLGIAASAASVIAMAGNEILMGKGAEMMIHMPWVVALGNADDLQKVSDDLRGMEADFIELYSDRSGMAAKDVEKMLRNETFLTAAEAIKSGFADGRIETPESGKIQKASREDATPSARMRHLLALATTGDADISSLRMAEAQLELRAQKLLGLN